MTECLVRKYYLEEHYGCASTVLHTCKDIWNLDITPPTMKIIESMCAAYRRDDICCAYSSCIALLHILLTSPALSDYACYAPDISGALYDVFHVNFGSTRCSSICQSKFVMGNDVRCLNVLKLTVEIMQELFYPLECQQLIRLKI